MQEKFAGALEMAFILFLLPFVIFTALAFLKNGMKAFSWSSGLLESVKVNIALLLLNSLVGPVVMLSLGPLQDLLAANDVIRLDPAIWAGAPTWLIIIVIVLASDFSDYWIHRAVHTKWLWPIHIVHHSDTVMNNTTAGRMHSFELVLMTASVLTLGSFLSLPAIETGLVSQAMIFYNRFVHIDADYHWGPFNKVLSSPRLHRWHHADEPSAYNKNFGNMFSFWDVLFGTYYLPGVCTHDLGVKGGPGQNILLNFIWPVKALAEAVVPERLRNKTA